MKRTWGIALALVGVSTLAAAAVNVSVNGVTYSIPNDNERGWGQNVRTWIQAISSNTLQPSGGQFILSNEVDFGGSNGLKSTYYKSRTANPASLGAFRLANADTICFRNSGNSGNLCLGPSATGNGFLAYDSIDLVGTSLTQTLTNKTLAVGSNSITGTSGKAAQFNSSTGALEASSVTNTELGYVSGVTSAIQTQLNGKQSTGDYVTALTGDVTASGPGSAAATVAKVGGKTASAVAGSVDATDAATSANTASTIVKRDASGNFSAGTITANLTGNVTGNVTGNTSGSAASFTGSLSGDVTGTQGSTVVATVGGKSASDVATSVGDTQGATNANTASKIVKRDASGNFSAGTITATLSGNATNVSGTVALGNGGTGQTTQQAAINALTGTQSSGKYLRSDGTDAKLSSIQAADVPTLNQNTTGSAASFTGSLSGDVTGTQSATSIASNAVTNAKLAQVSTATIKGRTTAGTGNVEDLTATQTTALLNNFVGDSGSGGTKGLVPAPASGDAAAGKFLKSDGNWSVPAGAGDVTGPASSVDGAVTVFNGTSGKTLKEATITQNNVLVGGASNTLSSVAPSTAGNVLTSDGTAWVSSAAKRANELRNVALSASISSSTLVIALKQADGTSDCSSSAPCLIARRDSTVTNAYGTTDAVTAAMSVTAGTTDSLGNASGAGAIVYVYYISDTTSELCVTRTQRDETALHSATAFTASGETTNSTLYCPSAHTSKPIRLLGRVTASWSNPNWSTITEATLYGPSTIAAADPVAFKGTSANTSVGTSYATASFTTEEFDTHNAYSSGVFTAPISGKYRISATIKSGTNVSSSATNNGSVLSYRINSGTEVRFATFVYQVTSVTLVQNLTGTTTVSLNAGDTLEIRVIRDTNVGAFSLSGDASTYCSIERIGP